MKKVIFILLFVFFVVPSVSIADTHLSDLDEELLVLQNKIKVLLVEVAKLQEALRGSTTVSVIIDPLTRDEIKEVLKNGTNWFKNAQEESGHFAYEYLPYENRYLDDDNIIRQAGGLYALGEIAAHDNNDEFKLKETLLQSIRYFDSLSERGEWNGYSFRCITNSDVNSVCQLGATSLALVGLIDTVIRFPELQETYDDLIHDYGRYIVAMKKDGRGFRHGYNSGSTPSDSESSFSNGEAILALVRYYMYSPDENVKNIIDDSFSYFESAEVEFDFPLYLWIMAALKDMHNLWQDERYVTYTKDYTEWRFNGMRYRKNTIHNFCAYTEGIASAYSVLEDSLSDTEKKRHLNEIDFWLNKSRSLQIGVDDTIRIIKDETGVRFGEIEDTTQSYGGFLTGEENLTQRIDFTQHCLNSYLQKLVDIDREKV